MKLPQARTKDIVVQNLSDEVLIYDLRKNRAYCLNKTAKIVFDARRESSSLAELKSKTNLSEDVIFLALDELQKADLLEENADYVSPFAGMSRREVIKKAALGALVALPVISFVVAPTAVNAQSGSALYVCSNPGATTSSFCATSPTDCNSQAKTLCATCGATASTSGLCSANPPGGATVTCSCGAACSNPGATTVSFCAATDCSQAKTLCANCSATASTSGLCNSNPTNKITCSCV